MRIMTGASLPEGADAVVPFEEAERLARGNAEWARLPARVPPGANVRWAGADLGAGEEALASGRELSPYDVSLLAALGLPRVRVGPRPRAWIVSTGDELLGVGEALRPGAIRDSNVPLLQGLLAEAGCEVLGAERASDDPRDVAARVRRAWEAADLVLTIGGVSAGDFDPVKQALAELGAIGLWRVAMKPGRPQAFGTRDGKAFHGLPGNPASVACVFEALTRPAIRAMQGFAVLDRPRLAVRTAERVDSRAGRTDFVRVRLEDQGGTWWARSAGEQTSGHLAPQARAHALLIVPEERPSLDPGDRADALLLRWPDDRR
jgi:molybdopterin molybdotransferase